MRRFAQGTSVPIARSRAEIDRTFAEVALPRLAKLLTGSAQTLLPAATNAR